MSSINDPEPATQGTFFLNRLSRNAVKFCGVQVGPYLWVDPGRVRVVECIQNSDYPRGWTTLIFLSDGPPFRSTWDIRDVIEALQGISEEKSS